MSRIQEILKKAERDGGVHRTRAVVTDRAAAAAAQALVEPDVALVEPPPQHIGFAPVAPAPTPAAVLHPPAAVAPSLPPLPADLPAAPAPSAELAARHSHGQVDARLVAAIAPQSIAAEQYRLLRTRVTRAENGRPCRAIIVTSPNKGDGKSLTAANLALTMAHDPQQRVLLLDGDLRRPSIHSLFGISETPGLSDVLMGGATLDDALVGVEEHRLTILPSGLIPTQPAELLGSSGMRRVLETLRTRFDRILIDMPPVSPLADVAIASTMADGVLMIVRAGVTPKPAIEAALSSIDGVKVLGLVLNDAGASGASYQYAGYRYAAG
jgi:capsular exopolysaccharide synthesis family protein